MSEKYISVSNNEYRQMEGISASDLKKMVKSMKTFKYSKDNPDDSDSPALLFGRAFHKYCLEPSDFFNEFEVAKDFKYGSKESKKETQDYIRGKSIECGREEDWNYFISTNPKKDEVIAFYKTLCVGKEVITQEDFEKIDNMRTSLYATPFAKKLLYGEHEKSFFWEEDGIKFKIRPDSFGKIGNQYICVDLKTASNAETEAFMRDSIRLNYDIQAAHYIKGLKEAYGVDFKFIFVAIEKTAPYLVNILEADENFIRSGQQVRESLIETYKKCLEKDEYPGLMGFSDEFEISSLGVPSWIEKTLESDE